MKYTYETLRAAVIDAIVHCQESRAQIICACGVGKTRQQIKTHEALKSKRTVVFVPILGLASQTLKEFKEYSEQENDFLVFCSDASVSDDEEVLVTLDENDIADFFRKETGKPKVLICTYQSSDKLLGLGIDFDLGLYDEAHYTAVNKEDSRFSCTLNEDAIKIKKRLFFTATPKSFGSDDNECSMDNIERYGEVIFRCSNKEAVASGLIKPFRLVPTICSSKKSSYAIDSGLVLGAEKGNLHAHSAAMQISLAKVMCEFNLNRAIVFHNSIIKANQGANDWSVMADELQMAHIKAVSISSDSNTAKVNEALNQLREGDLILHNCRIAGTGINVPQIDCVQFADPKQSVQEIIQNIGRGQRKTSPDDTAPLIVNIPLVIEQERFVDGFNKLIKILRTIQDEDEPDCLSSGRSNSVLSQLFGSRQPVALLNCDEDLDEDFIASIQLQINRAGSAGEIAKFANKLDAYKAYVEAHLEFPRSRNKQDLKTAKANALARWAEMQRSLQAAGEYPQERLGLINEKLPEFVWQNFSARGNVIYRKVALVKLYKRLHGHDMPEKHDIARWFRNMRAPNSRKVHSVNDEQWQYALQELGDWSIKLIDINENGLTADGKDKFLLKMQELKEYVEEHGCFPKATGNNTLHIYRYRLDADLKAGRFPERRQWLEQNWKEYFTTPNYSEKMLGRNFGGKTKFEQQVEEFMHLRTTPSKDEEGYGFCRIAKSRAKTFKLSVKEHKLLSDFMPWLLES